MNRNKPRSTNINQRIKPCYSNLTAQNCLPDHFDRLDLLELNSTFKKTIYGVCLCCFHQNLINSQLQGEQGQQINNQSIMSVHYSLVMNQEEYFKYRS